MLTPADRLQISLSTVYALVSQGALRAHRIGLGRGSIRIAEEELQLYLDSCKQATKKRDPRPRAPGRLKHLDV